MAANEGVATADMNFAWRVLFFDCHTQNPMNVGYQRTNKKSIRIRFLFCTYQDLNLDSVDSALSNHFMALNKLAFVRTNGELNCAIDYHSKKLTDD